MKLIIGLGNPGKEYIGTRHNAGFDVLNALAATLKIKVTREECFAVLGGNGSAVLARPQTFMNLSGEAAVCLSKKFSIPVKDIIVVHDELDLPLGVIRVKAGGGSAGHKGIQSCIEKLGTNEFTRIRVGISSENKRADTVSFVLSKFTKEENEAYENSVRQAALAAEQLLTISVEEAMNRFNR